MGNLTTSSTRRASRSSSSCFWRSPRCRCPTGGVTHAFEVIAALLALELIAGRRRSGCRSASSGASSARLTHQAVLRDLLKRIRWLERHSRPRLALAPRLPDRRGAVWHRGSDPHGGRFYRSPVHGPGHAAFVRGGADQPRRSCSRTPSWRWSAWRWACSGIVLVIALGTAWRRA